MTKRLRCGIKMLLKTVRNARNNSWFFQFLDVEHQQADDQHMLVCAGHEQINFFQ